VKAVAEPTTALTTEDLLKPHHRDVTGGPVRAAVFGVSDGLVSNVSLVLGVAGANPSSGFVRLAGLAGLIAGACSMAAGEYVSMQAQKELTEFELTRERVELARRPELERQELIALYVHRGISEDLATRLATEVMKDPDVALETHAREELGVDPNALGSPVGAAASSFLSFAVGAILPLFPWFFAHGNGAVIASVVLTAIGALVVGTLLGAFSDRPRVHTALRQLLISAAAAGITFAVGKLVGTGTGG
jgi:vacuolar iron transporter family protein